MDFSKIYPNAQTFSDSEIKVTINGVVLLVQNDVVVNDALIIAHQVIDDTVDYNNLHGFYKMIIHNPKTDKLIFFGDNTGSQFFYIDYCSNSISSSFLNLVQERRENLEPNYSAILQLFRYSRIVACETIVKNISLTSSDQYYRFFGGRITAHSKKLKHFSTLKPSLSLQRLINELLKVAGGSQICAVATGGTDSRTVLAHLLHNGQAPELIITGHKGNPDITIANKISMCIKLPLTVIDPIERESGWLDKGFIFSDGVYDSVLSYRHYLKAKWVKSKHFLYEYGGVGGEFYKNSYCHPLRFGLYYKKISNALVKRILFPNNEVFPTWFGPALNDSVKLEQQTYEEIVNANNNGGLLCRFNSVGYVLLSRGFSAITNNYSRYCTKIDPLMDRDVVASVCTDKPMKHAMQIWQRNQIHKFCPQLSEISTDQGMSCSVRLGSLIIDSMHMLKQYISLVYGKIKRMVFHISKDEQSYWEDDYLRAVASAEYKDALEKCRELGIISNDVSDKMIPTSVVGMIITVGSVFLKKGCEHD